MTTARHVAKSRTPGSSTRRLPRRAGLLRDQRAAGHPDSGWLDGIALSLVPDRRGSDGEQRGIALPTRSAARRSSRPRPATAVRRRPGQPRARRRRRRRRRSRRPRLLTNPYYKGDVLYRGTRYKGNHPALVPAEVWHHVQSVLTAHQCAVEATQVHGHYLKGTIHCGQCGSRLIVSNAKNRHGNVYCYFVCSGRTPSAPTAHARRRSSKTSRSSSRTMNHPGFVGGS